MNVNGFINIYKEAGWTSMDVCAKLRRILHVQKVGHAGTLDPMATGVLPVALGLAAKDVDLVGAGTKIYRCSMLLGIETDSQDITGVPLTQSGEKIEGSEIEPSNKRNFRSKIENADYSKLIDLAGKTDLSGLTEERIISVVTSFTGEYEQKTPKFSARKLNGKPLYKYAREGREIELKTKTVTIDSIQVESINLPHVVFTVTCSKGTYIRTLCSDIGKILKCGACMESLERLRIGNPGKLETDCFDVKGSYKVSDIERINEEGRLDDILSIAAGTAVVIGKFDGTHVGHQELFRQLRKTAQEYRLRTMAIILSGGSTHISSFEERKERLYGFGIDYCIELKFNDKLREMTATRFLEDILIRRFNVRAIVGGKDITFGKNAEGNADFLENNAKKYGIVIKLIDKKEINLDRNTEHSQAESVVASSTLARNEIVKGDMLHVARILGKPYSFEGEVVRGRHLGTDEMNIPTVNILVKNDRIIPPFGVYVSEICIEGEKTKFTGISNLGKKPTLKADDPLTLETNIFEFREDLYGKKITVSLLYFIREERKFNDLSELTKQLREEDIPKAEAFIKKFHSKIFL